MQIYCKNDRKICIVYNNDASRVVPQGIACNDDASRVVSRALYSQTVCAKPTTDEKAPPLRPCGLWGPRRASTSPK